jgi:hypothetical protein
MSVSDIRDRRFSFPILPGFRGACHRAGHFGPDPLAYPGYNNNKREAERRQAHLSQ